ncbi:hypothetical protein CR152_30215 [Massilia violaceinigra]|uniref:AlpA family transcriptional regulator n=1 Tax=Massilia violaceinigra TaxID=2045208 RepID=A0A2D2DTK2_9BURK|nr:AlpA family transcriptional regulator [Massilia violaceinigra]ATQ78311.1 hypothetical protein CR152_30215 [Massilia violaceinigra]
MNQPKKFLRLPAVIDIVGIQRTAIYERIKAGNFPKPISLGPRAVVWDSTEIASWQEDCIASARSPTPT